MLHCPDVKAKHTFILLDTFALLEIPQLQLMIQSAGQDESSIGREPHKRHRWVCLIYEGFQALPAIAVPDSAQSIIAAGDYECSIPVEVYSCDRI